MFEFSYLWVFLLLPMPLLIRFFLSPKKQTFTQIWIPLAEGLQQEKSAKTNPLLSVFIPWLLWILLLATIAKPIWLDEPIRIQQQSRDMILSLDLSGSMQEVDMPLNGQTVNRLTLVKSIVKDFVKEREGDRLGLILFADHAYLQTPLTFDLNTISTMVDETQIGLVGNQTAIGESIAMAIKRFVENKNEQRVLILLTDGANTAGNINPIAAAQQAAKNNITIYTIGIGADEMMKRTFWGNQRVNPSADLDEKTLTEIASLTNGQYFRARNQEDLQKIYNTINKLQPVNSDVLEFRPEKNLFFWPLSLALFILLIVVLSLKIRGKDEL
ncbi:VWA domain-containing protein [Psychromonas sp. RZ22]|uniref:VWA domain-containing protein n=1 Tax=Psychromonas algarum TaxID=2555643 RepID=UPI00106791ED|nr:VWA domain-containing protein [Psychromonas sp. RZ22]TEW53310.1 VWA domain-containing protein [Psychromonas sp. RZ22]